MKVDIGANEFEVIGFTELEELYSQWSLFFNEKES